MTEVHDLSAKCHVILGFFSEAVLPAAAKALHQTVYQGIIQQNSIADRYAIAMVTGIVYTASTHGTRAGSKHLVLYS